MAVKIVKGKQTVREFREVKTGDTFYYAGVRENLKGFLFMKTDSASGDNTTNVVALDDGEEATIAADDLVHLVNITITVEE